MALNVWQPEVVRGRQKQIVEQCVVSVVSRVHSLEMELRLCKQQIAGFNKAHVCVDSSLVKQITCVHNIYNSLYNFMAER